MLLRSIFDYLQGIESALLEVAFAVHGTNAVCFFAEATVVRYNVGRLYLAREQTTSKRVVDDVVYLVLAASWDELRLNSAG